MSKLRIALYASLGSLVTVLIWSFIGGCQSAPDSTPAAAVEEESIPSGRGEESLRPERPAPVEEDRQTMIEEGIIAEPESDAALEKPVAAPVGPAPPPAPKQVPETKEYTVRKGDTLWAISRKYGVTVEEIQSVNKIGEPSRIAVGQKLIIPLPD